MNEHPRLKECIGEALAAADTERGDKMSTRLVAALNAFAELDEAEIADSAEISKLIAPRLQDLASPSGMGKLAVWIGAIVEHGADPAATLAPLLDTFLRLSRTIPDQEQDYLGEEALAGHEETLNGMARLGQSIVSHLSLGKGLKEDVVSQRETYAEIKRVASVSIGADWIKEILEQRSGELLVLHGIEAKGFRLAYENIGNCFHLFSLLQAALEDRMPGAKKTSSETLAAARGTITSQKAHDGAWWHYGQGTHPNADLVSLIFGEANPDSIIPIDGTQVILLWPNVMERSWDGGFFSPTLIVAPPDVRIISQLAADEVSRWRERLGLAPTPASKDNKWSWLPWKKKP